MTGDDAGGAPGEILTFVRMTGRMDGAQLALRRFSRASGHAKSALVTADPFTVPLPPLALGFTGNRLDRDDRIRRDPEALWAMTMNPEARWLVLDELQPVMQTDG